MVATAPAPVLNPQANAAMQQIATLIEAQPAKVNALVDQRVVEAFQQLIPTLRQQITAASDKELGRLTQFGNNLAAAVAQTEKGLAAQVEALTRDAVAKLAPRQIQVSDPAGVAGPIVDIDHVRPEFEEVLQTVAMGVHVLLVGPAGSGKTTLASLVAKALGREFGFISLTAGTSESQLVGRFVPTGENGRFEYVPAAFVTAYENGHVFLLDEVDAADANVLLTINAALANGWMATPNPAKPIVKMHPDFRCIAAANTWGTGADRQYVGRNQLDAATLDRYACGTFDIDYDVEFERKVGEPELVEWAHALRDQVRAMKVRRVVSTRLIINGSKRLRAGHSLDQVKRSFLLPWTAAERTQVGHLAA